MTNYDYDWRDRLEYAISPVDDQGRVTYTKYDYDNLNHVVETRQYWDYDNNGPDGGDRLLSDTTTSYDARGRRVYQTATYAVSMAIYVRTGDSLVSNTWYDAAGRVIKSQPAGSNTFTKTAYDGLGRPTYQYVGYDLDETSYADAGNVNGDTILEQTEYSYDASGNVILVATYERNHDATAVGAMTSDARASDAASWYDGIGRRIETANYGTELPGGGRPAAPPSVTDADALASKIEYVYADANGDGRLEYVTKTTTPTGVGHGADRLDDLRFRRRRG